MPHKITVKTNGQTLTVNASVSHWTSEALALAASGTNDVESTTTTTITADYNLWFANTATTATITVKQLDGTVLLQQEFPVGPGFGPRTLNPLPDPFAVAADSGVYGRFRVIKSGRYYATNGSVAGTQALGTGVMSLVPFWSPGVWSADRMAVSVTTGAASAVVRLGIYGVNTFDEPSTLLLDAGTVDGTSTAVVEATMSYTFGKGLYYLAAVSQVGNATLRTLGTGSSLTVPHDSAANALSANGQNGYTVSSITGALADVTSPTMTTHGYRVALRAV
jgi:hypothetical protein